MIGGGGRYAVLLYYPMEILGTLVVKLKGLRSVIFDSFSLTKVNNQFKMQHISVAPIATTYLQV